MAFVCFNFVMAPHEWCKWNFQRFSFQADGKYLTFYPMQLFVMGNIQRERFYF
jgi:hypothetical protein